jgi:DNA-binding IclR family transcriptional regulator
MERLSMETTMTRTDRQPRHSTTGTDPFALRERAGDIRSRELAAMASSLLSALRQMSSLVRSRKA